METNTQIQGTSALNPSTPGNIVPAQNDPFIPTIDLPIITRREEVMEAIAANILEGESPRYDRISVPSGGGLTFESVDENNKPVPVQKIKGIILHFHPYKIRYTKEFSDKVKGEKLSFCFSADKTTGSGCEEVGIPEKQSCDACKWNQWGSDRKGGEGRDCHDRIAIWIAKEGDALPILIDLPRTSIGNFNDYKGFLTKKVGLPIYRVVTELELGQIDGPKAKYSEIKFSRCATIQPAEATIIKELIAELKPKMVVDYNMVLVHAQSEQAESSESFGVGDINAIKFDKDAEGVEPY